MRIKAVILLPAVLVLMACQHDNPGVGPYMGGPDNFGEANRVTMAAQVIDPEPVYDSLVPEGHAEHAGQAVERYRTDKVKLPERTKTTEVNSGESRSTGN